MGLWGACPGTELNPNSSVQALTTNATSTNNAAAGCDPNYAGCIPPYPPDLDCTDIKRLNLAPIKVIGKDVHKLDRDGDGIGCDK